MLDKTTWRPNYGEVYAWRARRVADYRSDPQLLSNARNYYRTRPAEFISAWCDTYDPRNAGKPGKLWRMPFVLFPRQVEFIEFLAACEEADANGLNEKSRTVGATWCAVCFSVHHFCFVAGSKVGWGSRKATLVDKIGDPDSIFEKIRFELGALPAMFLPPGFDPPNHSGHMKIFCPSYGTSITGEAGDDIGRGGRTSIYFKDEAQPLDTKILTPDGWRTMADMAVGSKVIGRDGKPTSVIGVKDCGVHDVYRVTFSDGTHAECSPNHLWTVNKWWGKKQTLMLTTREIAESITSVSPKGQTHYRHRIPVCGPVDFERKDDLPLDPYVVGALLGDGSVGGGGIGMCTADPEIIESFKVLLPVGVVVSSYDGRYGYRISDERGRWGRSRSRARLAVAAAGIYGLTSKIKFIPDVYKFSSPKNRLSVLQGLMDTDGSAGNSTASFHTSSPQLAEDVKFLVQSLGGTSTHNIKPDKRGYCDGHVLHLAMPSGMEPFRLRRKLARFRATPRKHPPGRTILSVSLVGRRPVRCISVKAKDGLYLTDSCVVTHNSAHYEHPESIEAALSETTRVQIDISSVNGLGNVFHRKREAGVEWQPGQPAIQGKTNVFVFDWSDHPEKDRAWFDMRRQEAEDAGLLHLFAQEVERNYSAAVSGTVIPASWVASAIDAHLKIKGMDFNAHFAGLDVADEGGDTNCLTHRRGVVLRHVEEWGERDTGVTARRAVDAVKELKSRVSVQYDCVGVGAGVKAEINRLKDEKLIPRGVSFVAWNAGAGPLNPDERVIEGDGESPLNKDFYSGLKAQGWWALRRRFEKTHQAVEKGSRYDPEELISLDGDAIGIAMLRKLQKELSQPTASANTRMKMVIDKRPEGTKSPNTADSAMMCFFPAQDDDAYDESMSWVRGKELK